MNSILLIALFAVVASSSSASSNDEKHRCGVNDVSEETERMIVEMEQRFVARVCSNAGENSIIPFCPGGLKQIITVPTYVHVIMDDEGNNNVSDSRIVQNMDIMNNDMAGRPSNGNYTVTNFRFSLVRIDRVTNNVWANLGVASGPLYKSSLTIDPVNNFNFYITSMNAGILGYSPFCFYGPQDSFIHGMTVHPDAVVGGAADNYNEGQTATHEAGHHLGLFHAWQGGCNRQIGQQPDDICPQETNSRGCPDPAPASCGDPTCPDNVHNHMDYSDDSCRWYFTLGQSEYMDMRIAMFHPGYLDDAVEDAIRVAGGGDDVWDEARKFQERMFELHRHEMF
jgi:hypothetical protein